jgi:phage FluMu gp28-like protein
LSPTVFQWYSKYLTNEALEGFGDLKLGKVILNVKYANDLVLMTKEETNCNGVRD